MNYTVTTKTISVARKAAKLVAAKLVRKHLFFGGVLWFSAVVLGVAQAALLGVTVTPPVISYINPITTATSYDPVSQIFSVVATPSTIRFSSTEAVYSILPPRSMTISVQVDNTGTLVGSVDESDLVISGTVRRVVGTVTNTYSGLLLTGEVTGFGSGYSGGVNDYDFRFTVTGGALSNFFSNIGVQLTSEDSTFTGMFTTNFNGGAIGNIGLVEVTPVGYGDGAGLALEFDGSQNYARSVATGSPDNLNQETLECWVKFTNSPPVVTGAPAGAPAPAVASESPHGGIIMGQTDNWYNYNGPMGQSDGWFIQVDDYNLWEFDWANADVQSSGSFSATLGPDQNLYDGYWHHLAVTLDDAGYLWCWTDGQLTGGGSASGTTPIASESSPIMVGAGWNLDGNGGAEGNSPAIIDEVRISDTNWYTTSFTPVRCLGANSNVLAYYTMDTTTNVSLFNGPDAVAVDSSGNLYVADSWNDTVRKITPVVTAGQTNWVTTTIAGLADSSGSADGTNSTAQFNWPNGVAMDSSNNLYVADTYNNTIRKITAVVTAGQTNWVTTTIAGTVGIQGSADGTNSTAQFKNPYGVAVDASNSVYVADLLNRTIRKITPVGTNWVTTTIAGLVGIPGSADGTNSNARFFDPTGVAVDSSNNLYVADWLNSTIRKITPAGSDWVTTTIAGLAGNSGSADGTNSNARFFDPMGIAVDSRDNLYVADWDNSTIRKITPAGTNWVTTTIAGTVESTARFFDPAGVAVDSSNNLYVADSGNDLIRKITLAGTNWVTTTIAGLAGIPDSADSATAIPDMSGNDLTLVLLGNPGPSFVTGVCASPPVADFSGSPTNGVVPLPVTFTDTSSGNITNWFWDFGDGNTTNFATATNPVYTYNAAGTYTVSLTVSGLGGSDTSTQTSYIVVGVGACTYTLSSPGGTFGTLGGSGSFTVNTPDSCAWTPSTTSGWIHPTGSGPGTGPVNYMVDANTGNCIARSGTITVGGQTFTVNQAAGSGSYALSAASTNVAASAGSGSVSVTAGDGCSWTAVSSTNWLHTSSSGTGNGTVSYTVDANGSANARSGSIATGGQSFTVNQAGTSSCTYSISATSTNVAASAGSGSVGVTAGDGCSWTAVSSTNWLHTSSSGTGNGTVSYTVDVNATTAERTGTITVGGQTFTVTQMYNAQSLLVVLTVSAVSTGQVNLSWSGGGSGVASYGVSRDGTQISTTGGANYSDDGLAAGTEYCYTVKAYDGAGNTLVQSAEACAQTFVTPGSLHGIYNGLVIQTNAPTHESSGSIKLVVSKTGSFSAHLTMGGVKAKFKGQFDASGNATNTVPRTGLDPLQAILHLDVTNGTDQITGTVSDNSVNVFMSELLADRAVFSRANPCPWADRYTVVLEPPEGDATNNIPQGYGYGTLTVTTSGGGKLRGVLGDGTKISDNVPVSKHATWPLYDALYKNQGACIGWVTFATNPTTNSVLEATVDWFRPSMPTSAYYPAGFTTNVTLIGDKYVSPSAGGPSPAGDRQITLGVGNLVSNIVQAVSIDAAGNVTVSPPNSENLKMKLQLATGLFSGSFTHPSLETTINFKGAVLQPDSSGAGYFLGTNESGFVTFELPVP